MAQQRIVEKPEPRIPRDGTHRRHRQFTHASQHGSIRRVRSNGCARDAGGALVKRPQPGKPGNLVYGHSVAGRNTPVLHLLGNQRPAPGTFAGVHDSPQMAAQHMFDHRIVRWPQLVDDVL